MSEKNSGTSTFFEVVICSCGIFFFYFWFSLAQHDIYVEQSDGTKFSHTSLQLFAMILVNTIGAYIANKVLSTIMGTSSSMSNSPPVFALSELSNPYSWLSIGLCFYGAMDASNRSLKSLSYPVMVLGKSCKMIPVMLSGVLINGTKYRWTKYISVFVVTAGIVIVNFYGGKGESDKKTEIFPLLLLILSLVLDAMVGPRQEHHKQACQAKGKSLSPLETMYKTNIAGLVWVCSTLTFALKLTKISPFIILQYRCPDRRVSHAIWMMDSRMVYSTFHSQQPLSAKHLRSSPIGRYVLDHENIWRPFGQFAICSVVGQVFIFYTIIKVSDLSLLFYEYAESLTLDCLLK